MICVLTRSYRSSRDDLLGHKISRVVVDDPDVFVDATNRLLSDDSHSLRIRVKFAMGSNADATLEDTVFSLDEKLPEAIELEGQGVLIYEDRSGRPSHVRNGIKVCMLQC